MVSEETVFLLSPQGREIGDLYLENSRSTQPGIQRCEGRWIVNYREEQMWKVHPALAFGTPGLAGSQRPVTVCVKLDRGRYIP